MSQNKVKIVILLPLYMIFSAFLAGAELNWSSALGYNLVPLIISFFIVKRATNLAQLIGASIIVIVVFSAMNFISIKDRYDKSYAAVYEGCFERNVSVSQLATQDEKQKFCTCFANEVSAFAMLQDAKIFYNLIDIDEARQSTNSNAFLNDAFMGCSGID